MMTSKITERVIKWKTHCHSPILLFTTEPDKAVIGNREISKGIGKEAKRVRKMKGFTSPELSELLSNSGIDALFCYDNKWEFRSCDKFIRQRYEDFVNVSQKITLHSFELGLRDKDLQALQAIINDRNGIYIVVDETVYTLAEFCSWRLTLPETLYYRGNYEYRF